MPLAPDDLRHLRAAQGYCELGMHVDAHEELENIDPEVRHVPEVLEVRVNIYCALEKWDVMQTGAKKLAQYDPENAQWTISWAYAIRRAELLAAARLILVNSLSVLSSEPIIYFNLVCYECQPGNLQEAKSRLAAAIKLKRQ